MERPVSAPASHPGSATSSPSRASSAPKPRTTRGKYISKACFECRKRKSKCNGRNPCLRCSRHSLTCAYPASKRRQSQAETNGGEHSIQSLKDRVASLQGELESLRQDRSRSPSEARPPPRPHTEDSPIAHIRLISPDHTDPGSHASRNDQASSIIETPETPSNCQPSASYTFNFSLARTHLQARGIAMTEIEKQGTLASAERTRPPSPLNPTPIDFGTGSVDPMWLVDEQEAIRLCNVYEVEIGIQYPFLDIPQLLTKVRNLYKAMASGSRNGFAFTTMPGPTVIDPQDLDLIKMVISAGSIVEAGGSSQLGRALFRDVRKSANDKMWEPAGIKNAMIFVLLAIYSFISGDDLQAWRLVGVCARWCLEIGLHQSATVARMFKDPEDRKKAMRLFWSVYTLDRRWGFGAGLPFVMHHCDVDQDLPQPDEDVPYLKAMVDYSQIGNKVWSTSYNSARATGTVREDDISYLQYLIDRWYEELPPSLQLSQDWESKEWTTASRGPQRLQLLLHLRTNQMKILLLQPVLQSSSSLKANRPKVQLLVKYAKDTIQKLGSLNRSTDIYQTQQMCFNHFLVSALGVIFLVVALAPLEYGSTVRDEFHLALDLIRGLSAKSYVSSRLWKMVGDLRLAWKKLGLNPPQTGDDRGPRAQRNLAATPPPSSSGADVMQQNPGGENASASGPEAWQPGPREPVSDVQMAQELTDFFNAMETGGEFATSFPMLGICGDGLGASTGQSEDGVVGHNLDPSMLDVSHLYVDML